jgi:broad specificity phosphatase PhoE
MIQKQNTLDTRIVIYTSPFQRCIDTSLGILRGMQRANKLCKTPILRLDLGLGEWMCERFFDTICPATHLMSRQQEKLARLQAYSYSMMAKNMDNYDGLPPITIDYAYQNPDIVEFDYPERYTDMIHRFEETRLHCLQKASKEDTVIFVTHAVGVNALLDGFRNKVTIPLESNYCSISCVRHYTNNTVMDSNSDQSDEDEDAGEFMDDTTGYSTPSKSKKWSIELAMSDTHLTT